MDKTQGENSKLKLFTKKDFAYWVIFLMEIIVFLLVWRWDSEQHLANQISLVGSVFSILLALVAIGYTFFQTQSSSHENKVILNTLMKVNDEINKLESINDSLRNINKDLVHFKNESSSYQEKTDQNLSTLRESLEDKSWIDELSFNKSEESMDNLKEELKNEYERNIDICVITFLQHPQLLRT